MPTDIDDLVPIEDQKFGPDEDSVLETLFPESFYVVSANGLYLTSVTNFDIFQRVLDKLEEQDGDADASEFREELAALMDDADELSQDEYDDQYERSSEDDEDDIDEDDFERERDE
jgi:hypothetical protein